MPFLSTPIRCFPIPSIPVRSTPGSGPYIIGLFKSTRYGNIYIMDISPIQNFYNFTFNRIGESGSFLINTGLAFNPIAVTIIALLPHGQIEGIGTIPETTFRILIRGADLVLPPKMSDRILFRGRQYTISELDPIQMAVNGITIAYSLQITN